mmetsp:Transcript_115178/g.229418  ORF Transcript_115178/g.229418 Transcript_115178/m.229418 type:complete len:207 (+) Transcript_115178:77-697(+)
MYTVARRPEGIATLPTNTTKQHTGSVADVAALTEEVKALKQSQEALWRALLAERTARQTVEEQLVATPRRPHPMMERQSPEKLIDGLPRRSDSIHKIDERKERQEKQQSAGSLESMFDAMVSSPTSAAPPPPGQQWRAPLKEVPTLLEPFTMGPCGCPLTAVPVEISAELCAMEVRWRQTHKELAALRVKKPEAHPQYVLVPDAAA